MNPRGCVRASGGESGAFTYRVIQSKLHIQLVIQVNKFVTLESAQVSFELPVS